MSEEARGSGRPPEPPTRPAHPHPTGGVDMVAATGLIEEVVRAIDGGEVEATSAERAYLMGSMTTLRAMARTPRSTSGVTTPEAPAAAEDDH